MTRARRAAALLLVLGTLALMAALAVTFARASITERLAGQGFADHVRARMLAEAGVERALGHLQANTMRSAWDSPSDTWVCTDPPRTPLDQLDAPSLAGGTAHGRAYSGLLGSDRSRPDPTRRQSRTGTYAVDGDQYVLRVTDLSARLDLRHPDRSGEGNVRLLANLATLLGVDFPAGPARQRDQRPGGFSDTSALLGFFEPHTRESLAPYLTVHAWRDETALQTIPGRAAGRGTLRKTPHGRAPLNLNLAPPTLIEASLIGIAATYLDVATRQVRSVTIGPRKARRLTGLVTARRAVKPFRSHADLEAFLATLVGKALTGAQASLIAVHANPDAQLLKFNPDRALFGSSRLPRLFDRSDLVRYTVEYTFRSGGVYRIASLGRVIGPGSIVAARAQVVTIARLHTRQRVTSQRAHLEAATLRQGLTLHPESCSAAQRSSPLTGRIGLAAPPTPGLAFFAKGALKPITAASPTPGGTARTDSVFDGGNRYADGYHGQRTQRRHLSYAADDLGIDTGSVSFWWKPDWQAFDKTGGLFYADTPTGTARGLSTAIYYQRGVLTATRTYYHGYNGQPGAFEYDSRTPVFVRGNLHSDAYNRLSAYGYQWLRSRKPGGSYWHYKVYGDEFAFKVLQGIGKGKQHEVLYIYDVEKSAGMAHLGCITQYIQLSDFYPLIYQTGYQTHRQAVNTLAYLDVVDESGKRHPTGQSLTTPYAVSRSEKGASIADLQPHRWYHIRVSWSEGTDLRLFVDGVESRDHARYFGPLNPWRSRLTRPLGRYMIGAFELERASAQAGTMTPQLRGRALFVGTHGTISGLSISPSGTPTQPTQRYRASGRYEGRVTAAPGLTLARVTLSSEAPPGTAVRLSLKTPHGWSPIVASQDSWPEALALHDASIAYRLELSAAGHFPGKLSPFVDSLTFLWQHAPVILARRER